MGITDTKKIIFQMQIINSYLSSYTQMISADE